MQLKQPRFTQSACGPFTKNKETIKSLKKQKIQDIFLFKELDKACLQHDIAYRDFEDLNRRTGADKVLDGQAFNIAENSKYGVHQCALASIVYEFSDIKTSRGTVKNKIISNKESTEESHKTIIRKFEKIQVKSSFTDNIWGTDLADMRLISKLNKEFRSLLCVIDSYSKYTWAIFLKDTK